MKEQVDPSNAKANQTGNIQAGTEMSPAACTGERGPFAAVGPQPGVAPLPRTVPAVSWLCLCPPHTLRELRASRPLPSLGCTGSAFP